MTRRLACEERDLYPGEIRAVAVDFSGLLDDGETLVSVISAEEADTNLLELTGAQVNGDTVKVNGVSREAGYVFQMMVDHNSAAAGMYVIDIECSTSASQEVTGSIVLIVH